MNEDIDRKDALSFIKNAESVIVAAILALVLWMGLTTYDNSLKLTEMGVILDTIKENMTTAQTGLVRRLDEYEKHLDSVWPRMRELKERVQYLESRSPDAERIPPWRY